MTQVLPLRKQADIQNEWLEKRLATILPRVMDRAGLDMWIICTREYNEDPVLLTLLPEPHMSARRRTILVFVREDGSDAGDTERIAGSNTVSSNTSGASSILRYSVSRYPYEGYEQAWDPANQEQWEALRALVEHHDPGSIGIDMSETFAFADGVSLTEGQQLLDVLGETYARRCQSAETAVVGWLETRLPEEIVAYEGIMDLAHSLISTAFSRQVIHPGITTTDDVVWWMRQQMIDLGLSAWFHPTVDIQAPGQRYDDDQPRSLIQPGDLLHCDVGLHYLGLATDTQQHAYILRPGEDDAPADLRRALAGGNQLQDILMAEFVAGRTGNEILEAALAKAQEAGLNATIYSHPLGYHGHGAGPMIGLWDQQGGVPGTGDYPLHDDTCYSIELNVKEAVDCWDGQEVRVALEQDAVFTGGNCRFIGERQTSFHLI